MATQVTIKGADRLATTLERAADELRDLGPVNTEAGEHAAETARRAAPRRSGALAASIGSTASRDSVQVHAASRYAGVINYGWPRRNIAAQPFLTNVLDDDRIPRIYLEAITRIINRIEGA